MAYQRRRTAWPEAPRTVQRLCVSLAPVSPQANAAPSFVSSLQGPVQDAVAPAHWIGRLVGINSKTEEGAFADSSPTEVYRGAGSNPDPKP